MFANLKNIVAGAGLAGILILGSLAGASPTHAAQVQGGVTGNQSGLTVSVSSSRMALGGSVLFLGTHFTPGARVSIYEHGPYTATLGRLYGSVTVGRDGGWKVVVRLTRYPDAQAQRFHTIILAAKSSAIVGGVVEGGAAAVRIAPDLVVTLDRTRIHLGQSVLITGRNFTPGRPVTLSIGGPNVRPHSPHIIATIDTRGQFEVRVGFQVYPDAEAQRAAAIVLNLSTGADESTAVLLQVNG